MSTAINTDILKNFIISTVGTDRLTLDFALKNDIEADDFAEANKDENFYLDIDEIIDNKNLYNQFATMFIEDKNKRSEETDAEKEKEEQMKIKDKNGANL